jgi:hypothetical protein
MPPYAHPLSLDFYQQHFTSTMASPSAYSPVDTDRFMAREQHVMLSQSSEPEAHEETGTETDFAGCGGQFAERKGSYPHQIDISEEEDSDRQPCSPYQAEPYLSPSPGRAGRPSLGSPPTTPTPTRGYQDAHLVQPSEVPFGRDIRWGRRRPRRSSGTLLSFHLLILFPVFLLVLSVAVRSLSTGASDRC